MFTDDPHLFVADTVHPHILIWNILPTENSTSADFVLGQPDFASRVPYATRDDLFMPTDVCFDDVTFGFPGTSSAPAGWTFP